MDNQDKIFEQFKEASQKAEAREFPAMEKVWSRVEDKLDKKEDKKVIALWKKLAVAASILLFLSLGYQIFFSGKTKAPLTVPEVKVTEIEKTPETAKEKIADPKSVIRSDADKILEKQIQTQAVENVAANEKENREAEETSARYYTSKSVAEPVSKGDTDTDDAGVYESKKELTNPMTNNATMNSATSNMDAAYLRSAAKMVVVDTTLMKGKTISTTVTAVNLKTGEITINGVVSDYSGPLPGVNVIAKKTNRNTQTDFDGKYTIKVEKGDLLEFSYIGMKNTYARVDKETTMNIAMAEDAQALNEVVVVGYGISRKEKKSEAQRQALKNEEYISKRLAVTESKKDKYVTDSDDESDAKRLKGRVTGVDVSKPDALEKNNIMLRGKASIEAILEPLYIVNGVPISTEESAALDPKKMQSVRVLKGDEATALYGAKAANGAIIITTGESELKLSKKELRQRVRELEKAKKEARQSYVAPQETTQEDYDSFIENQFESPVTAPQSTFSIDVDNASYTNVRRFINNGQTVPKDAVRIEELVNFFKYDYPQPKDRHPFSIHTEYAGCPWNPKHQLLKIGLQGKNLATDKLPASNLVFLVDVSGSMEDANKLPLLKESMKILVKELRPEDRVSIVVYAGAAGMVLPSTSGDQKQAIIEALDKLNAGGSTAGGAGIELAYKTAQENFIKGGNNRVILATDGDFNVGASSNADMQTLIEQKRQTGIFLTCLGYGMGNYKDSRMEILADKGNGNYAYIDNIQEANRFLGKEFKGSMFAIAKDVKIQIEFNPQYVQSYRLIGYENRKLRPEDFTNDAIDAGELGSGHTVTALYEVIPAGIKTEFYTPAPELKFVKTEPVSANFNNQLAFVKFRYKKPDSDTSIEMDQMIRAASVPIGSASPDFKFSAAVAWFGLKLRDSKLIGNKSSETIKKLAKEGLSNDPEGYRSEFIRLVETAK